MKLLDHIKAARRCSTPLISISTPDPGATIDALCKGINGDSPKLEWDFIRGFTPRSEEGREVMGHIDADAVRFNPMGALIECAKLPEGTVVFFHLANRFLGEHGVIQALWNLRDQFKQDRRMVVLLGPEIVLPAELQGDVVAFDEPLPDSTAIEQIIRDTCESAELLIEDAVVLKAIEAVQGLPAFQVEQITAMSLTKDGLDVPALWERKEKQIEQTPGLKVCRDRDGFDAIGGVEVVKDFLGRIMAGQARPNAIVFVDEIEKMLAGAGGDLSGVSSDQLGSLLSYMQDQSAAGMIFIGPPGAAKSAVAKAAGHAGNVPTIQLDLGAAKGSLVGQSEQQLRSALKVITSVSNGRSLWIATCNKIANLPPELRRRFTLGTFFFDLPDADERSTIWNIWLGKYNLNRKGGLPNDEGWTGAEIRQCTDIAWRLGCSLVEAGKFVVPISKSAASALEQLRSEADGKFLSASYPGVYRKSAPEAKPKRKLTDIG